MEEIWKPVLGFEKAYEASNLGLIRSIDREVWRGDPRRSGGGCFHMMRGRVLKPSHGHSITCGYPTVMLSYTSEGKMNKRTYYLVHRIVWAAFNGKIPEGYQIDHIDDNPLNNHLDNLQCLSVEDHKRKTYSKKIGREWYTAGKIGSKAIHQKLDDAFNAGYQQALRDHNLV